MRPLVDKKSAPGPAPARDPDDVVEEMERIIESEGRGSEHVPPLKEHYGGGEHTQDPAREHPYSELLDAEDGREEKEKKED